MAPKKQTNKGREIQQKVLKLRDKIVLSLTAVAMVIGFVISIGENLGLPISWDDIYNWLGMNNGPLPISQIDKQANAIHFIDIGQGDASLLQSDGEYCLIDAGLPESKEALFNYLDKLGVTKIKLLVMSHPHADHIGSMAQVIDHYEIEQILLPDFSKAPLPNTATFNRVLDAIERKQIPTVTAKEGQSFAIGKGILEVLADGIKSENVNDLSQVLYYKAGNLTAVLSGDAEKMSEKDALKRGTVRSAKVFKAGHHGSNTSNTKEFLAAINPEYVVISCGEGNRYNHPHKEPMERFKNIGAQILRTDLEGDVVILEQNGSLQSYTAKGFEEAA